ncbi:hypothetical protein AB0P21_35585 [Kribbella sp. NPDC056861]|uniref:hypothetical protein n=1 Tax=Kribbella sp. NPDC056861 TaxID=3154857 RepID=UPI0034180CE1
MSRQLIAVAFAVVATSFAGTTVASARPADPAPTQTPAPQTQAQPQAQAPAATCAYGHFCVTHNGRTDDFYRCGTYPVTGWTGTGYVYNNQTPGTWAQLLTRTKEVWRYVPNQVGGYEDLNPVWYVKPC